MARSNLNLYLYCPACPQDLKNLVPAGSKSHRIAVEPPTDALPVYTFGKGWVEEEMGSRRVMGDATLLPNGMVVLLNGAEVRDQKRCIVVGN